MSELIDVNTSFREALKKLRTQYKLTQTTVAKIAGIEQAEYSSFETGNRNLGLNEANNLSFKIWGTSYNKFVEFSSKKIIVKNLPKDTRKAIELSKTTKLNDDSNLLANELDRLINEGRVNKPITAKILHSLMHKKLKNRSPAEITSLLNKEPRNHNIRKLDNNVSREKVFIYKDFFDEYNQLSTEELKELIEKLYPKKENKEATDGAGEK